MSTFEQRTIEGGFVQSREIYDSGKKDNWRFQILGFSDNGTCRVRTTDGYKTVLIDNYNKILINGRKCNRNHWDH